MSKLFASITLALGLCTALHAQVAGEQINMGGSITTLDQQGMTGDRSARRDSTVVDRGVPRDV